MSDGLCKAEEPKVTIGLDATWRNEGGKQGGGEAAHGFIELSQDGSRLKHADKMRTSCTTTTTTTSTSRSSPAALAGVIVDEPGIGR